MYTQPCLYTQRWKGVQGRCRRCPAFLGTSQRLLGGSKRKNPQNCPPRFPPPWPLPSLQLAPQIPFFPYFSSFGLFFSAVFPRRALLFPPKWSCGRSCPWIQRFSGQERLPGPTPGAAFLGLLLDFGGFAFFFCFLFHLFLASSPELGQAGSDSAALPEKK